MKNKLLILLLFILISCKKDNNPLTKIMIEYHESKNDYTTIVNIDFSTSEIYFLNLYNVQSSMLKTPEEYAENKNSIYKSEKKSKGTLKRKKLKNEEIKDLLAIVNSFEEKDFESKNVNNTMDGAFVNYHLIYTDNVVNIERVNNSTEKHVQFNNLIFSLLK